jgi:hypothetical protein
VSLLPSVAPMPLARFDTPFEHPDWIFEPKLDGFRSIAMPGQKPLPCIANTLRPPTYVASGWTDRI